MNRLHLKIMETAIERMRKADEQLAIALNDLKLIHSGKKKNGNEADRLLREIEEVKSTLADVLTLAINRNVFDQSTESEESE